MTKFDGRARCWYSDRGPELAQRKAGSFQPGDMVEITGTRKHHFGAPGSPPPRFGMVVSAYKPTGAAWITRLQVLIDGQLEDINVSWLKKVRNRKVSSD